jgi:hypothetical protein
LYLFRNIPFQKNTGKFAFRGRRPHLSPNFGKEGSENFRTKNAEESFKEKFSHSERENIFACAAQKSSGVKVKPMILKRIRNRRRGKCPGASGAARAGISAYTPHIKLFVKQ